VKSRIAGIALILSLSLAALSPLASAPAAHAATSAAPVAAHTSGLLTKFEFVAHVGLAYWAFHRYVWKPYKAHALGVNHKGNTVKAGLALLFAYHELKVAYSKVQKDKGLSKLAAPLKTLADKFNTIGTKAQQGNLAAADVTDLNNSVAKLSDAGQNMNITFKDLAPPLVPTGL